MYRIRKTYNFESAHILMGAETEACRDNIHGHSYIVEVFLESGTLNPNGMVLDFGMLNASVKSIFDEWDHAFVMCDKDARTKLKSITNILVPFNPTAENMAKFFFKKVHANLALHGEEELLAKVRVHETATGYAEYFE